MLKGQLVGQGLAHANAQDLTRRKMFEEAPYFPKYKRYHKEIDDHFGQDEIVTFSTIVRKEHEGVWYAQHIITGGSTARKMDEQDFFDEFMLTAYKVIKFGKVNPDLEDAQGEPIYPKDSLQITEEERLIK